MANLLESSQTKATCAPGYYTNYLSNLATSGQAAQQGAQFVGAQPLQTKAYGEICQNFGATQPAFQAGEGFVGQAAGQNITGAAAPYLAAGTGTSPLSAFSPYAQMATQNTAYCAGAPMITQGAGLSGLTSASPYLGRAAGACGAGVAAQYVNPATSMSAACAAKGYLSQAAARGGLCAANPYLARAAGNSPADMAAQYMNPYLKSAVQSMSDIGQRNIQQNLSPAATAAAVGSGQFGSQRGAQVLGQIQAQAEQCLNNQVAQMMSQGYGQALGAAGQQQALLGNLGATAGTLGQQQANLLGTLGATTGTLTSQQQQNLINAGNIQGTLTQQQASLLGQLGSTAGGLTNQQAQNMMTAGANLGNLRQGANTLAGTLGGTAATAQQAQNAAQLQAAQTAANAAASQGQLLNQSGLGMGTLGAQAGNMNLACINALATLGGQQQTILQNQQNFPLSSLSSLAGLLQGYNIPTTTKTMMQGSPASAIAALYSGYKGINEPMGKDGKTVLDQIKESMGIKPSVPSVPYNPSNPYGPPTPPEIPDKPELDPYDPMQGFECIPGGGFDYGGGYETGICMGNPFCYCSYDFSGFAKGGLVSTGLMGCSSTKNLGALPKKR